LFEKDLKMDVSTSLFEQSKTKAAYLWTSALNTPFWAIFNLLPFILYKDLGLTPIQVMIMIALKPGVSLIAPYWSALIEKRKDRLLSNLIWARILSHLPFFFFPYINNPWFFIASFGFYMMLARGTMPAWMEILKLNLPNISRERIFAYGTAFGYIGAALFPFALGGILDHYEHSWRWIFPSTAFISLMAVLLKLRIPIHLNAIDQQNLKTSSPTWKQLFLKPWKSAWNLIKQRPDFARYQLGFMLGGAGLIILQPALPLFFMDQLQLSYTELAVAMTLCKGVGVAVTSSFWAKLINKIDIYRFNGYVTFLAFLFPFCLIAAQLHLGWIYIGYILYGIMQAGSELSWHLSGPLFAKQEDSSVYSSINVLSVGLRGCFFPILGSFLSSSIPVTQVLMIGSGFCLLSTFFMALYHVRHTREIIAEKI
jgi:MFS family permease